MLFIAIILLGSEHYFFDTTHTYTKQLDAISVDFNGSVCSGRGDREHSTPYVSTEMEMYKSVSSYFQHFILNHFTMKY